jgi:SIR2-like domain
MVQSVKTEMPCAPYSTLPVSELKDDIVKIWCRRGLVFLVGSYISTLPPTNLPSGYLTTERLWRMLLSHEEYELVKADVDNVPFETIMQLYPDRASIRSIIRRMYSAGEPNQTHECLASSMASGRVKGVITTNYDLAFDTLAQRAPENFAVVYDEPTLKGYREHLRTHPDKKVCFKIHGTASKEAEETIVCDLEAEGRLKPWKRELLKELLRERTLIVIGYSGRDFDICPELAESTKQSLVVWFQRNPGDLQPNADRVLSRTKGVLVHGSLETFLQMILKPTIKLPESISQAPDLSGLFDVQLLRRWRMAVLNWMGFGNLLSETTFEEDNPELRCAMLGHIGRYKDLVQDGKMRIGISGPVTRELLQSKIDLASAQFIYGQHLRAWLTLRQVERDIQSNCPSDESIRILAIESKMMMYMRFAQFARVFAQTPLLKFIQQKATPLYDAAAPILEQAGAWARLQALQQNAERIGVAKTDQLPLPYRVGYRSLGLVSMDVIATRDQIRGAPWTLTADQYTAALECIEKANRYGWHHEAWKFHWILLWRGGKDKSIHFRGWWRHFWRTQYPLLARLFQLILNLRAA